VANTARGAASASSSTTSSPPRNWHDAPVTIEIDTTHVTSIGDQPSQRKNATWPDHAPVIATID
jgi:hypothetical protein